jgi:hypothetical protein
VFRHKPVKAYGVVVAWLHSFFTSAIGGSEWLASRPVVIVLGAPRTGCWVGRAAGLDTAVPSEGIELRSSCPASSRCAVVVVASDTVVRGTTTRW